MLEQLPDMDVLAETGGREVIPLARRMRPDLVLIDIDLPLGRGLEIIQALRRPPEGPPTPTLVLTMRSDEECVFSALRAGARGFLLKGGEPEELYEGIRAVARGNAVITPCITARLLDRLAPYLPHASQDSKRLKQELTPRERDVLWRLSRGMSNLSIARALGLSEATVRSHVHHVLTKLDLEDRTQAVAYVYQAGLFSPIVDPPDSVGH